MRAQEAFDELIAVHVWPVLRSQGFRRQKATFHRLVDGNWEVVNFQRSVSSDAHGVRFTVNLAVGLGRLRRDSDWHETKRPAESRCHVRERLANLLTGKDTWWRVDPDTNTSALAETLLMALDSVGRAWLEAHSHTASLLALARDPETLRAEPLDSLTAIARLAAEDGETAVVKAIEVEAKRRLTAPRHPIPTMADLIRIDPSLRSDSG